MRSTLSLSQLGDASFNLAITHIDDGFGVPQDDAAAVRWSRLAVKSYRLAADQGDADAQAILGLLHREDVVIAQELILPQELVAAYMWSSLAAAQASAENRDTCVDARDAIAKRMTLEQIAEAQRLAGEWEPTGTL